MNTQLVEYGTAKLQSEMYFIKSSHLYVIPPIPTECMELLELGRISKSKKMKDSMQYRSSTREQTVRENKQGWRVLILGGWRYAEVQFSGHMERKLSFLG